MWYGANNLATSYLWCRPSPERKEAWYTTVQSNPLRRAFKLNRNLED